MMRILFCFLLVCIAAALFAQDSPAVKADTNKIAQLSGRPKIVLARDTLYGIDTTTGIRDLAMDTLHRSPWKVASARGMLPNFRFTDPNRFAVTLRQWKGQEPIFYSMIALLLSFALIRNSFSRYMSYVFEVFFRTSLKQRTASDQVVQNPFPSLLLNLFFLVSGGMFAALALQQFHLALQVEFWQLFLYCLAALLVIYTGKFLSLKFFGWVFGVPAATDAYIFIVFTTNKIVGVVLLPFLVVMAFTGGAISSAAFDIAILFILALLAYRFFLSYITIQRQIRIGFFHFLLYIAAFEVAPLLLINKLLFTFLG